jgi:hypothetical protein
MSLQRLIRFLRNLCCGFNGFFFFEVILQKNNSADVAVKFRAQGDLAVDITGHCK